VPVGAWVVSVDFGGAAAPKDAKNDFTALSMIECLDDSLALRDLRHLPIDQSFTEQQETILKAVAKIQASGRSVTLVGDSTGLGKPQLHLLREKRLCRVIGIWLTAGNTVGGSFDDKTVPKVDVITAAQLALEQRLITWNKRLELANIFARELRGYRFKVRASGSTELGNHRGDSDHDDLVLSVAMACWWALRDPSFAWTFPDEADEETSDRSEFARARSEAGLPLHEEESWLDVWSPEHVR
jgi:hypothetical protein